MGIKFEDIEPGMSLRGYEKNGGGKIKNRLVDSVRRDRASRVTVIFTDGTVRSGEPGDSPLRLVVTESNLDEIGILHRKLSAKTRECDALRARSTPPRPELARLMKVIAHSAPHTQIEMSMVETLLDWLLEAYDEAEAGKASTVISSRGIIGGSSAR